MRRAFTSFQLMTILDENQHIFLIVEHDPMLYEDAEHMVEYVAQHLRQTSRVATILLYAPVLDPHLEKMTELADRVFCYYEIPTATANGRAKAYPKVSGPGHAGGILMRLPWRLEVRQIDPTLTVSIKAQELNTTKEILAEVFQIRPVDAEEMIKKRLEDRCWQDGREDGLWPATFFLGE